MEDTKEIPSTSEETTIQDESQNVVVENAEEQSTDEALKAELEKLQENKTKQVESKYTEEEKARFTVKKIYEKFPSLQEGTTTQTESSEDDAPVTKSELLRIVAQMQTATAEKSALELANGITNPVDREMVKFHIENTIRPSGNAQTDLAMAQSLVNAKRNEIALSEQARRGTVKTAPSGSSAPAKEIPVITLTPEEQKFVASGLLTQEEVLKARKNDAYGTRSIR